MPSTGTSSSVCPLVLSDAALCASGFCAHSIVLLSGDHAWIHVPSPLLGQDATPRILQKIEGRQAHCQQENSDTGFFETSGGNALSVCRGEAH